VKLAFISVSNNAILPSNVTIDPISSIDDSK
jgi:hypothetical protein